MKNGKKGMLFVWDNSPSSQLISDNHKAWVNIVYHHCPENLGLSHAYNCAAKFAQEKGYEWIMLLDQDTTFSENVITKIYEAIKCNNNIFLFAPIIRLINGTSFSPTRYKHKRGYSIDLHKGIYSLSKYSPVNSGMVINIKSFWESGGYNSKINLDFADFQFIERFRRIYKTFYLIDTVAIQDFSNDENNIEKLKTRFNIYCECAKKCEKTNLIDYLEYFYSVLRHTIGLIIKTHNFSFFKIFIDKYIF